MYSLTHRTKKNNFRVGNAYDSDGHSLSLYVDFLVKTIVGNMYQKILSGILHSVHLYSLYTYTSEQFILNLHDISGQSLFTYEIAKPNISF